MSTAGSLDARELVDLHESTLDPHSRRALGAHYTPEKLSSRLVELAAQYLGRTPRRVCDPSCGAGAVLLAAADHMVASGVSPDDVLEHRLVGFDIDPGAVAAASASLGRWASAHGVCDAPPARVWVGDALDTCNADRARVGGVPDLVVGNPPFSSPLSSGWVSTSSVGAHPGVGWESSSGAAYTDTSAAHLLAAAELVGVGGVVCMLQPQSVLGARDAGPIRSRLLSKADLVALWATDEQLFDAGVEVCAPVLVRRSRPSRRSAGPGSPTFSIAVHWRDDAPVGASLERGAAGGPATEPNGSSSNWSPLLAVVLGVPRVPAAGVGARRRLRELATCTAGFRDEFYALAEVAVELPCDESEQDVEADRHRLARLVTSGMIDPGTLSWGVRPRRLARRSVLRPAAPLDRLAEVSPKVGRWASRRAVPKVMVASQTRVVEAVLDRRGDCLPVTPVISVEPIDATVPLELIAAVLGAPSTSARIASAAAGTGLSAGSLRIRAATLGDLEVPEDTASVDRAVAAWLDLEALCAADPVERWRAVGSRLDRSLGVDDEQVVEWWLDRLPGRRTAHAV